MRLFVPRAKQKQRPSAKERRKRALAATWNRFDNHTDWPEDANKRKSRHSSEYDAYLQSAKWKVFRLNILSKRGARCEDCGDPRRRVTIHHLTYKRLGRELPEDVKVLCNPCHRLRHAECPQ